MNPSSIELHDAVIDELSVNFAEEKISLKCEYYEAQNDRRRKSIRIVFNKVTNFSSVLDIKALINSSRAGNITYWHPSEFQGVTYVYFSNGCVAIQAESIDVYTGTQ